MIKFFFLTLLLTHGTAHAFKTNDCRNKIENAIYVNDEKTTEPKYVVPFLETFDLLPEKAQKFMCKFDKFTLIETEASAWSTMDFRKGIFDAGIDSSHWHSWKDQLNFGAKNDDTFSVSSELPTFKTTNGVSFLYWIILHELGHNFGQENESEWENFYNQDFALFPEAKEFCFYWCEITIPVSKVPAIYKEYFEQTKFLSLYSSRSSNEFWAETFMYYVAIELTGLESVINMPNGTVYRLRDRLLSDGFKERRAAIIKAYDSLDDIEPRSKTLKISSPHFY